MRDDVFLIPLWVELLAVGIGSLQGAAFAAQFRDRRLDLLGVALVGIATGLGGGMFRDLVLNEVPRTMQSNWYLPVAVGAALGGMLLQRLVHRLGVTVDVLDAVTIGMFAALGTTKALAFGLPVIPAIFVGSFAAVGGSILRDLLLGLPIAIMQVGSLYAVAAIVGTGTLVVLDSFGVDTFVSGLVCVVVTFAVRVLAIAFNWRLPEQRHLPTGAIRIIRRPKKNPPTR
ncbi:MAG TPA: TRIC cation channel family protein [Protaetiibacter sp.]|nr:TRIC cation channel family protein [Protaetiibacter sp.]